MATAYAALVSLFNNLELILNHPFHSFSFENKQIQSLRETVCYLMDFMEICNYHSGSREAAEVLERRIASAAHAADDVVESHVVDQIHAGSTLDGKRNTASRFLIDLQKAIADMDFVKRKAMKVKAQSGIKAAAATPTSSSSTPLTPMVRSDDLFLRLLDMLIGDYPGRPVIPIVGMGGIGKTRLATDAFQHKSLAHHFDFCRWVVISQQYSAKEILLQLLYGKRISTSETVAELGTQLHKELWGRRYLIVLDDIWSVEAWNEIQLFFPDDNNGSRVVLTTRQQSVADYFGHPRLAMKLLDNNTSWNLFCEKAFLGQGCPPELEDIGRKIVGKCKGLPLAIIVVGGHLRKSPRMQEYWENVAENMSSVLDSRENGSCLDILSLSYSHLPVHLKPCFLYMGTLQEDQKIYKSDLIKLWISEGFLKSSEAAHSLEEVAEAYIEDLIDRNLILGSHDIIGRRTAYEIHEDLIKLWISEGFLKSSEAAHSLEEVAEAYIEDLIDRNLISGSHDIIGRRTAYEIHDLLRELCLKIAKQEKFLCALDTPRAIHRERRVVINEEIPYQSIHHREILHALRSAPLLRSLKYKGCQLSFDLRLLRVLNRVNGAPKNKGCQVFLTNFQQVNLRYIRFFGGGDLGFEACPYLRLPSSINLLWNLQTLIFYGICLAPHEIWEMPQLRHFESKMIFLPDPFFSSTSDHQPNEMLIQTLSTVANLRLREEVWKRIPHIKKLQVLFYDFGEEYYPHNLVRLHNLESLDCSFSAEPKWHDFALSFTFPNSLKELSLTIQHLEWEELNTLVAFLPVLEVLRLRMGEAGEVWNPVEGGFLKLKSLSIEGCPNLISWNAESFHFPALVDLNLAYLSKLDEFPSGIGEIPTLQLIMLMECSVSSAISAVGMLVEQENCENYGFDLIVLFSDDEKSRSFHHKKQEEGLECRNLLSLGFSSSLPDGFNPQEFALFLLHSFKANFSNFVA